MRKHALARVSYRDDFLISYRVYMFECFSSSHEQHNDAILNWRKLRMCCPFQSTGNGRSFWVYIITLRNFLPEKNSRSGTTTRVSSRRWDSRQHDIVVVAHWNLPLTGLNTYVMVTCKQIQNHERKQEWTRAYAKFAPLSCKHPFVLESVSIVTWQFMPPFFFSLQLVRTRKNCFYRKRFEALFLEFKTSFQM